MHKALTHRLYPGVPLFLHSRARILDEVTHTQGHDVILLIVLQTGLIVHRCVLNPVMECSSPAAKPAIHLVDMLVTDPKNSACFSLLRENRNDSHRFKAQFYNAPMISSLRVPFLCLFFLCLFLSPSSLFPLLSALLRPHLRSDSLTEDTHTLENCRHFS